MTPDSLPNLPAALTLPDLPSILRRRQATILQAFLLITLIAAAVVLLTRPVYQSTAELLVTTPAPAVNTVDTNDPLSPLLAASPPQSVQTQAQVLQTRSLQDRVRREVGPAEFTVTIADGDTNVIQVDADATRPQEAAEAANRLLELYVAQDADQSLGQLQQARAFVQAQASAARQRLYAAEDALADFQRQSLVLDLAKSRDEQIARLDALTDQYGAAQTGLASLRAQIRATQRLLAEEPATLPVRLATTNTEVAVLEERIHALQVQREGLTQPGGFTSQAPPVRAIDAQIAELSRQRSQEPLLAVTQSSNPNTVRDNLRNQLAGMQAQAASLEAQVDAIAPQRALAAAQLARFASWEVASDRLTRRRDATQTQAALFSANLTALTLREKARLAAAQIIERAVPPQSPLRPKRAECILFAAVVGLCVGLCLALLQESLDDRMHAPEQAIRATELPALARIPVFPAASLLPETDDPESCAESLRFLRTSLHFAAEERPLHTLLVTSASSGEGKTTTAARLAFALAAEGRRVILAETDLHRPALHTRLELPPVPGLTDVLLGRVRLEDVLLEHTGTTGLSVLTCGSVSPQQSDLLHTQTFHDLLAQMRGLVDWVVLDSPPLLEAADASTLAAMADGILMVVEMGRTREADVRRALDLARQARAHVLGLVCNKTHRTEPPSGMRPAMLSPAAPRLLIGSRKGDA